MENTNIAELEKDYAIMIENFLQMVRNGDNSEIIGQEFRKIIGVAVQLELFKIFEDEFYDEQTDENDVDYKKSM